MGANNIQQMCRICLEFFPYPFRSRTVDSLSNFQFGRKKKNRSGMGDIKSSRNALFEF